MKRNRVARAAENSAPTAIQSANTNKRQRDERSIANERLPLSELFGNQNNVTAFPTSISKGAESVIPVSAGSLQFADSLYSDGSEVLHLSPSLPSSTQGVQNAKAAFREALVNESGCPTGRQKQFDELMTIINSCRETSQGKAIYVSGLPGTGKSLTIRQVVESQKRASTQMPVLLVYVNCMTATTAEELHNSVCQELLKAAVVAGVLSKTETATIGRETSSKTKAPDVRLIELVKNCCKPRGKKNSCSALQQRSLPILVLDEIDSLLAKSSSAVKQMFQLPLLPGCASILFAIANSLDLTERHLPELQQQGFKPHHCIFPAYTKTQLFDIVQNQLSRLPHGSQAIDGRAIEMCARAVAANSGDVRQATRICILALDLAAGNFDSNSANLMLGPIVTPREMSQALSRLASSQSSGSSLASSVKSLPIQQQLALFTVVKATETTRAAAAVSVASTSHLLRSSSKRPATKKRKMASSLVLESPPVTAAGSVSPPTPCSTSSSQSALSSTGNCKNLVGAFVPDLYRDYVSNCRQLMMQPVSQHEFSSMCDLLSQVGLLQMIKAHTTASARVMSRISVADIAAILRDAPAFRTMFP